MKGLLVFMSAPRCSVHSFSLFCDSNYAPKSQASPPNPHVAITHLCSVLTSCQRTISSLLFMPNTCRLDPFPWSLPRVCTCHFLLALPNANCLMMRLSICYWSSDLLPPLFTCLCRPPPAKRRAIHLPNTDSQLPPWMFCSIRPRFPCSYSSGLSSVWDTAGPGKLGESPGALISRW